MKTSDFDYILPPELIAQTPIEPRDQSRMMVIDRSDGSLKHHRFFELADYLRTGDVLVFNDSRVIPARLSARKVESDGELEILLLRRLSPNVWETLVKPARRVKTGTKIEVGDSTHAKIAGEAIDTGEGGLRVISFSDESFLPELGKVPLPPYIHLPLQNPQRYQTVYAHMDGSVAAPTAGLHFTPELINKIEAKGVRCLFLTLHIGLDTFRPVDEEDPLEHTIHQEFGLLNQKVAAELSRAKSEGRRIICVGTTSVRLLEAAARTGNPALCQPFAGWVDLFIVPGYQFRMVDGLLTNFHLPRSTLLMLVTAFAGKGAIDKAYREAIAQQYRFYSFGDCMLIL
ncbi:MAG: tRNA preQ1(34) S-adenosylmethionine ribosyltransferase-isomerase QueA [Chloroflexi bacterium]|nr:tRNA preQ1(34) S-adenosylmethionine ribosyltransferase-isomerase QueA [Chloroflexota bacterium]